MRRPPRGARIKVEVMDSPGDRSALLLRLRADQSARWLRGESYTVEDCLRAHPALADDEAVVLGLVDAELLLRQRGAERPTPDEYLRRFPRLERALRQRFATWRWCPPAEDSGELPTLPVRKPLHAETPPA